MSFCSHVHTDVFGNMQLAYSAGRNCQCQGKFTIETTAVGCVSQLCVDSALMAQLTNMSEVEMTWSYF